MDAPLRGGFQRVRELIRDLTRIINIGLKADALPCGVDRGQHGREDLVAIDEDVVVVAVAGVDATQCRDVARVLRVVGGIGAAQAQRDLVLGKRQAQGDDESDKEKDDERPAHRRHAHFE